MSLRPTGTCPRAHVPIVLPLARVVRSVGPAIRPSAMEDVALELAFVRRACGEEVCAGAVHLVLEPCAFVALWSVHERPRALAHHVAFDDYVLTLYTAMSSHQTAQQ